MHGQGGGNRRRRRWPTSPDGASLAVGGFGLSGVPNVLIEALYERRASPGSAWSRTTAASTAAASAVLLAAGRIARVTG